MAQGINIEGATSTNPVGVDSNGNVLVNTPVTTTQAGYVAVAGVVSDGTAYPVSAPRQLRRVEASDSYRMRSGVPTQWHFSTFPGSNLDSSVWTSVVVTMATAVAAPGLTLNSAASAATSAVARVASYRWFPIYLDAQVRFDCNVYLTSAMVSNTTAEWGLFQAATTAVPVDGVFFRVTGQNQVIGVLNNDSNEITINLGYVIVANTRAEYSIVVDTDAVYFYINQVLAGTINIASTGAGAYLLTANPTQPITFRIYNSTVTAPVSANKLVVLSCSVSGIGGLAGNRPWHHAQCGYGGNSIQQGGITGAQAMTALYKTEVAPGSSTLSNTTSTNATLGGQWQYAAVGTSETDDILYAYLNPAGSATVPGKTLYITGILIDAIVTVQTVATTNTVVQYGVGIGGTAVSLLTADGAGTKAARRIYIGLQSWSTTGVSANIGMGAMQGPTNVQFAAPLVVNPGEYFHLIVRPILGTATASQVWRGTCMVNGYFE